MFELKCIYGVLLVIVTFYHLSVMATAGCKYVKELPPLDFTGYNLMWACLFYKMFFPNKEMFLLTVITFPLIAVWSVVYATTTVFVAIGYAVTKL